jgi:hypothetical protein
MRDRSSSFVAKSRKAKCFQCSQRNLIHHKGCIVTYLKFIQDHESTLQVPGRFMLVLIPEMHL